MDIQLKPTKLSSNTSTAMCQLGTLRTEWSSTDSCFKTYKYVQAASDTTVANGTALGWATSDVLSQTVSSDANDFSTNRPAGVGIGAITASYYGWILVDGYHSAIIADGGGSIVNGDNLNLNAVDGTVTREAAGTNALRHIGVAVASDDVAGTAVAGNVECL